MKETLILLLSIVAGGCGYLIVTFWSNPILRYLQIRHDVTSDLIFYANVVSGANINEELLKRHDARRVSNRKHAAEMTASYYRLPRWYRYILKKRNENPIEASKNLIGLSNSITNDQATPHLMRIKISLCLAAELDI